MCWRNVIVEAALDTGALHAFGAISTRSASGSENAPLVRWPGSETDSAALAAVEMTLAVVLALYSFSTPGANAPNDAAAPSVSESVAGTVPPTGVATTSAFAVSPGAHEPRATTYAFPGTQRHRLGFSWLGGMRSFVACSYAYPNASSFASL